MYVFAGGGSAGHALPSLRVANALRQRGESVAYIGSEASIEAELCQQQGIAFHPVRTGKLNRSRKRSIITAVFANLLGVWQAYRVLRALKPAGIFSSGGFASVPVVIAGRLRKVSTIIVHACDLTPGLANRLVLPFATHLSCTFSSTLSHADSSKAFLAGPIVDPALLSTERTPGEGKPQLLVYGGSLGSQAINAKVRDSLPTLLRVFDIVHICGKNNLQPDLQGIAGYTQHEFVQAFNRIILSSDVALCRAGSNSLWELILTETPHLAIPLPLSVSRGDQIENCKYFASVGATRWQSQEEFTAADLLESLLDILQHADTIKQNMRSITPEVPAIQSILERLLAH